MQLDHIIGAACDAVLEPERWPSVLDALNDVMESNLVALRVMDRRAATSSCWRPALL